MGKTNYFEAVRPVTALHAACNLGTTGSILFLYLRQLSIYKGRKFVFRKSSVHSSLQPTLNGCYGEFFVMTFVAFVLSRFRANFSIVNFLLISGRTVIHTQDKSSAF